MTAPGNSTLLLTLLAAFVACTGYAGGRLHQWYRMGQDRDDAYRDGYDTATRSVFSLAARVISPRRADRPGLRGTAAVTLPASAVTLTEPPNGASRPDPQERVSRASSETGPRPASPETTFRASSREGASRASSPEKTGRAASSVANSHPASSGPVIRTEQASAGATEPSGRHTVPDELVQAATYRLAPDRVARAKVHGALSPDDMPLVEDARRTPVPKPRAS